MRRSPTVDGRRKEEVREYLESIAPAYTHDWDPGTDDAGAALVAVFAELAEHVLTRLDRVPEKQFVSFLDTLGARRTPPQPSRLPLQVAVADDAPGNIVIPSGTQAIGAPTDDRPEQVFEIGDDDGFEATAANVTHLYSVLPATDAVYDHWQPIAAGTPTDLFDGPNQQTHALYIGDGELLTLAAGSTVRVTVETNAPEHVLRDCFVWECYGETEGSDEPTTGWHPLTPLTADQHAACEVSELAAVESFIDDRHDQFRAQGYDFADHPPAVQSRLLASIAAAVTDSPFGEGATGGPTGTDQPLPPALAPPSAFDEEFTAALRRDLGDLRDTLHAVSRSVSDHGRERPTATVTIPFELPVATAEHTVDGRTSRWLRCRLPTGELARSIFDIELGDVRLDVGTHGDHGRGDRTPDALLANDVPLSVRGDGDLYPFGQIPQHLTTFYVASAEAFTKPGTTVELRFTPPTEPTTSDHDVTADVSWEYWNGSGWTRLPRLADETAALTTADAVRFDVPHDLTPRRVAGHDGHWIRARLVAGDYGQARYEETDDGSWERTTEQVTPPRFGSVTVQYSQSAAPAHLVPYNDLAYGDDVTDGGTVPFRPFRALPETTQTLYIGFDRPLTDGPIQLYFPIVESERPGGFAPRLRWECRTEAAPDTWTKLESRDGTDGLHHSGIVSLVAPEATIATDRFGTDRHWLRARVTGDAFTAPGLSLLEPRLKRPVTTPRNVPEPLRPLMRADRARRRAVAPPPALRDLHVNVTWAYNRRTVPGEILGTSDGSPRQAFTLTSPPATTDPATVWVDELATLSAARRRDLLESRPETVDVVRGADGDLRAFWVQWTEVADFLGSGTDDRHYTLDRAAGSVMFGDGTNGKIPPSARQNIRATYRRGGGTDGNVAAHAVTELKRSVPFVDAVTNPEPAAGGADAESTDSVLRRAPKRLADWDRSVYAADFERIAMDAAGDVARAECIPGLDDVGDRHPGRVTVLIVPAERETRPEPSAALQRHVAEALEARSPATVVHAEQGGLAVRGPRFVELSVTATIEAAAVDSLSALEDEVTHQLATFLHPLAGGTTPDGWPFGTVPHRSDLYALLEGLDGVDHVADLVLTFRDADDERTVTESDRIPRVPPDTLICSGPHDVTVVGGQ